MSLSAVEKAIAMPNTWGLLSAHFVHFGGSITSGAGRWGDRHADGATRAVRFLRSSRLFISDASRMRRACPCADEVSPLGRTP